MRFFLQVIFTSLVSCMLQQFVAPWAVVLVAAIFSMLIQTKTSSAFLGGFAAISLLWMVKATIIDVYTDSILSAKVAVLLGLRSTILLILLTGLIGGILGGLGAASGQQILKIFKRKKGDFYRI
ncbi:MAG: hypothetical protein ACYC2U_03365 [Candidatus Amoebophilus sp.]